MAPRPNVVVRIAPDDTRRVLVGGVEMVGVTVVAIHGRDPADLTIQVRRDNVRWELDPPPARRPSR